jgi:ABC-type multidrug transport system ATPase subunit
MYVSQQRPPYLDVSFQENLELPARLYGIRGKKRDKRISSTFL